MFSFPPDHHMLIAHDRRERLEREAVVRRMPTDDRTRLVGADPVCAARRHRWLLRLGGALQLVSVRPRGAPRPLVAAVSNPTNANQGEQPCLPALSCQPSLTSR
jgi:hypothetical protein